MATAKEEDQALKKAKGICFDTLRRSDDETASEEVVHQACRRHGLTEHHSTLALDELVEGKMIRPVGRNHLQIEPTLAFATPN